MIIGAYYWDHHILCRFFIPLAMVSMSFTTEHENSGLRNAAKLAAAAAGQVASRECRG